MSGVPENDALFSPEELAQLNVKLESASAAARIGWALERYPSRIVLSSSFGAQAAVSLHLVTQLEPDVPVVLIDTGYLFPETYRFVDELTARLKLNLKVYRAPESPACRLPATAANGSTDWKASNATTSVTKWNRCSAPCAN